MSVLQFFMFVRSISLVCVCFVIPFTLNVRFVDVPAEVTQEEVQTRFLIQLPSAVLALTFLGRRIQPSLSLVDREVNFLCINDFCSFSTCWAFFFFNVEKNPITSSCDQTEIRTHVPTSEGFGVTN